MSPVAKEFGEVCSHVAFLNSLALSARRLLPNAVSHLLLRHKHEETACWIEYYYFRNPYPTCRTSTKF